MLSMLQSWKGTVEVNGNMYSNIQSTNFDELDKDNLCIKLFPAVKQQEINNGKTVFGSVKKELRITVKQYMTRKATEEFDFMAKWNNDVPMPLRTMQGTVEKETRGMVYMYLHGVGLQEIHCLRCGKKLTHPVSRHYGIGPECMQKLGIVADMEDVENIKEQLVKVEWSGWIIKSAITEQEAV